MAIFYVDFENGNDANDGTSWANAWKTFTTGATALRIAPGDEIRVAKSADPTSLGQTALWTGIDRIYEEITPTSSTNATPIVITKAGHGVINGDIVQVYGHTVNTNANGKWKATKINDDTFSLDGSVGNGVGGASGKFSVINHRVVQLTNAVTQDICNCDDAWTAGAGCTVTKEVTIVKEGTGSVKIVCGSSGANQILAKFALPASLNLSTYEQISFWLNNSAALTAGDIEIRLYSDTACTSLVETLPVGTCVITGRYRPEVINKGAALSSTVQGIALYAVASQAGRTYYLDNFIACKAASAADSITLRSLISKNIVNDNGDHAFFGIQSIKDNWIVLDNVYNTYAYQGKGYSGATENITTYKREGIVFDASTGSGQVINESGNEANVTKFIGGYNTVTNERDGYTVIDGLAQLKSGIYGRSRVCVNLSYFQVTRFYYGLDYAPSIANHNNLIFTNNITGFRGDVAINENIVCVNNTNGHSDISMSGTYIGLLKNIVCNNNTSTGISSLLQQYNYENSIDNIRADNNSVGLQLSNNAFIVGTIISISYNKTGVVCNSSTGRIIINRIIDANHNTTGISLGSSFTKIFLINNLNNNNTGIFYSSLNNYIYKIEKANYSISRLINFGTGSGYPFNYIYEIVESIAAGLTLFVGSPIEFYIYKGNFTGYNTTYSTNHITVRSLYLIDCVLDKLSFSQTVVVDGRIFQHNYNLSGNHYIATEYGFIENEAIIRHTNSGISWKIAPTNAMRTTNYPIKLSIAKIYCTGGSQAILACWVKKTHATDIGARLLVDHFINPTVPAVDVIQVAAETINWQQLILYVTPLADGVIELTLEVFWQANEADEFVYVDDVSAAQLT